MYKLFFSAVTLLGVTLSLANGQNLNTQPPAPQASTTQDICNYKTHDWSDMRNILVAISRSPVKNEADVQKIAREALAGSQNYFITNFELQYAHWQYDFSGPNNSVCFPKMVTFGAIRNEWNEGVDGYGWRNDAAYECEITMNVKGAVLSISCKKVAE